MLPGKSFVNKYSAESALSRRLVQILLQGVSLHAFEYNGGGTERFQDEIQKIRHKFDVDPDGDSAILLIGAAVHCIEEYNTAGEAFVAQQRRQLQGIVSLLTDSLMRISNTSRESSAALKQIQTELGALPAPENPDTAAKVKYCLAAIVGETERQRQQGADAARDLQLSDRLCDALKSPHSTDRVTGLPGETEGAQAIRLTCGRSSHQHVAVFAADRLDAINLRFGFKAGDRILLQMAQAIAQALEPSDRIYRWRGPCFALLLERRAPEPEVQAEMEKLLGQKFECPLVLGSRQIVAPVTGSWIVFPIPLDSRPEEVLKKIDDFAISRARAGTVNVPDTNPG